MSLSVPIWACAPFALLLLAIAALPLAPVTQRFWEKRPVQLGIALALGIPVGIGMWLHGASAQVVHSLVEYVQFISLLLSLFVVSGGIFVAGDLKAQPHINVMLLACGALLASFIGTTGAAMLLIRPILRTNQQRRHSAHTVIFAIFLVANSGGLLTPLGDPPLFLGMLRGVPFTWTLGLLPEWLFMNGLLLLTYWGLDRRAYALEDEAAIASDNEAVEPVHIEGKAHFACFLVILAAVALIPSIDLEAIHAGTARWHDWLPLRELVMLSAAAVSYFAGSREIRFGLNAFSWAPISEVAALFIGIFLTMIPALMILRETAPALPLNAITIFAFTGGLSSVLDNAPTYVTFFEMAKELPADSVRVAGVPVLYLKAVSLGAVFGGAVTYIGNGPNFMVKALAESSGVRMPSFGGYILRWSLRIYIPALAAMTCVFICEQTLFRVIGIAIASFMAVLALVRGFKYRRKSPGSSAPADSAKEAGAAAPDPRASHHPTPSADLLRSGGQTV